MKKIVIGLALLGFSSVSLAEDHSPSEFDCNTHPSCVLQVGAWDALAAGQYEVAVSFAAACVELNEDEARKQQASLSTTPADGGFKEYGALNHAGTCYFIKGEALMKLKDIDQALAAYKMVVDEFSYSQAWDPKGWFWTVADAARPKVKELENP